MLCQQYGVTVIRVPPCFVYPQNHITRDMTIPSNIIPVTTKEGVNVDCYILIYYAFSSIAVIL